MYLIKINFKWNHSLTKTQNGVWYGLGILFETLASLTDDILYIDPAQDLMIVQMTLPTENSYNQ